MQLNEDQKLQVLLAELQERYNAAHKIRERSIKFTLWISGMAIGLGWLLLSQKALEFSQRLALSLLILALFAGTIYFIMGLRRGFQKNREAMIRSERALGMHEFGLYLPECPLLPEEYMNTKRKWSDHFRTLYAWLILVAMSLLILTWESSESTENSSSNIQTEQIREEREDG